MAKLHNTFCSFGRTSELSAEAFKNYFLNYNSDQWEDEGGGSLQYFSNDDIVVSLMFVHHSAHGLTLAYDRYDKRNSL